MEIAIIGHGNVGGSLAKKWAATGHQVRIGARNPESSRVKALQGISNIEILTIPEAAARSEVTLVAIPSRDCPALVPMLGNTEGKVIIDATNTIGPQAGPYLTAYHAFSDLTRAEIVKCFNSTGFENILDPTYGGVPIDMFMAGNSEHAKEVARQLALDAGFGACYDFGGTDQVKLLEHFAMCWINLAIFQGQGRNIAWRLIKR